MPVSNVPRCRSSSPDRTTRTPDMDIDPARREPGPEFDDTPQGLRAGRRRDRSPGHRAAAARHRGRGDPRRLQGPRGRHRLGGHPAERGPAPRPRRLRHGRGHPAAGRAGAGGGLRPRRAHPLLRRQRQARPQGARRSAVAHPPQPGAQAVRSRCPRSPTARSRSPQLAREAGHRTKIAVRSKVPGLNAKGACIGPMGPGCGRS
jgi:hypothetical protein